MFIVSLSYRVPLEIVEQYLSAHVDYLHDQYGLGNFQGSGRKVPRTGGIILSQMNDNALLQEVLEKDPFYINDLAEYEIMEFIPTKASASFEHILEQ